MKPGTTSANIKSTILVVDDEPEILTFVSGFLTRTGFTVLMAASGADALRQSRNHCGPINLLLSDIEMPGMTGIELSTRFKLERPGMKVMFMSGYAGRIMLNDGWHFLPKPFVPLQLLDLISSVLVARPE
jgi:two-component system cell cycle sensor histidine kinase/response regulator CckA